MLTPELEELGFCGIAVMDNPSPDGDWPLLVASRCEDEPFPTVLLYGHGDVVDGEPENWMKELDPWALTPGEEIGESPDKW